MASVLPGNAKSDKDGYVLTTSLRVTVEPSSRGVTLNIDVPDKLANSDRLGFPNAESPFVLQDEEMGGNLRESEGSMKQLQ